MTVHARKMCQAISIFLDKEKRKNQTEEPDLSNLDRHVQNIMAF